MEVRGRSEWSYTRSKHQWKLWSWGRLRPKINRRPYSNSTQTVVPFLQSSSSKTWPCSKCVNFFLPHSCWFKTKIARLKLEGLFAANKPNKGYKLEKWVYMCKPSCTTDRGTNPPHTLAITGSFRDRKVKPTMLQDHDKSGKGGTVETPPCDYLASWAVSAMAF